MQIEKSEILLITGNGADLSNDKEIAETFYKYKNLSLPENPTIKELWRELLADLVKLALEKYKESVYQI